MNYTVVGAGIVGLLTTYRLAEEGHDVTLVDQGDIPNPAATSFDHHRIVRALHPGDPVATTAAASADSDWTALERDLGVHIYERVGAVTVLDRSDAREAVALLTASGRAAVLLPGDELAVRHPHLRFPAGAEAVFEPQAGVLLANRLLLALAERMARHRRVAMYPHTSVSGLDPMRSTVTLADGTVLGADGVVVAAGPWSRVLLPDHVSDDLVLWRQSVAYRNVGGSDGDWSSTPAIPRMDHRTGAWLVPPVAGTPLKLSAPEVCRRVDGIHGHDTPPELRRRLLRLLAAATATGELADIAVRDCYYLSHRSSAGPFAVDLGPSMVAAAACGGTSFKLAPAIARDLLRRVAHRSPTRRQPTAERHLL